MIVDSEIEQAKAALLKTEEWRSLDNAKGSTLDLLGGNVGQERGKSSDEIYRVLIRGKEALNRSDGTINKIIEVLSVTLDCSSSEINLYSLKERGIDEPAAIIITKAPLDALNRIGLTPAQFTQIVQKTTLAGVRVDSVEFNGTFEFGTTAMETDPAAGFADIEGTTGGYFGLVFVPSQEEELPF
ncbi:hypothetical protein SD77_3486 [Bacillus badius]|uniref:Uncharacterized protein n=1 Tax=Bacillus badius TaxID=1455 RepID=A0ABR5ANR7_BACBA|nr:hypothetical protein SD77_3486 [Bacillus badius]